MPRKYPQKLALMLVCCVCLYRNLPCCSPAPFLWFFHCLQAWINSPSPEEPAGTGELEGVGERLTWLIWPCKTESCLLSALGGLSLCIRSCATAQLYQNRARSSDLSPTWTHYSSLSGRCTLPMCYFGCLSVQSAAQVNAWSISGSACCFLWPWWQMLPLKFALDSSSRVSHITMEKWKRSMCLPGELM